ncbi:MAG: hypothetical protein ACKO21_06285, partial [Nodosilinea sp.]
MQWNQPQGLSRPARPGWLKILNWVGLGLGLGLTIAAKLAVPARADPPFLSPVMDRESYPLLGAYDLGPVSLQQRGETGVPASIPVSLTGLLGLP